MPESPGDRVASFELARAVFALLAVVSAVAAFDNFDAVSFAWNRVLFQVVHAAAAPTTNLLVLTSAYFLSRQPPRPFKAVHLWFHMLSIHLLSLLCLIPAGALSVSDISPASLLFPFLAEYNWFVAPFLVYLCLVPALKFVVSCMSRKTHFLVCLFILANALLSVLRLEALIGVADGRNTLWFCALFLLGSYLAIYDVQLKEWSKAVFTGAVPVIFTWGTKGFERHPSSGLNLVMSLALFLYLLSWQPSLQKFAAVINPVAAQSFGVWVMISTPALANLLIPLFFNPLNHLHNVYSFLTVVWRSFLLYAFLSAIDFVRKKAVDYLYTKLAITERLERLQDKALSQLAKLTIP